MIYTVVLSLFPGIGLLDRAFEEVGFSVVRGPDVLWGGDIRRFHMPPGRFDGVIGGPPCQFASQLAHLVRAQGREPKFGNLIPEFERVVGEAQPAWWLMENIPAAPEPCVSGYIAQSYLLNNRWLPAEQDGLIGPEQNRVRRFSFGTRHRVSLAFEVALFEAPLRVQAILSADRAVPVKLGSSGKVKSTYRKLGGSVTAAHGYRRQTGAVTSSDGAGKVQMARYTVAEALELQGLPSDYLDEAPFTVDGKRKAIANGVPIFMGRALAKAIKLAMIG